MQLYCKSSVAAFYTTKFDGHVLKKNQTLNGSLQLIRLNPSLSVIHKILNWFGKKLFKPFFTEAVKLKVLAHIWSGCLSLMTQILGDLQRLGLG